MAKGLIIVWMEVPPKLDEEFNAWYNTEHAPERERVPGFLSCRRFVAADSGPHYFTAYLVESLAALHHPQYLAIRGSNLSPWSRRIHLKASYIHRNVYEEIVPSGGDRSTDSYGAALLLECSDVPAEREAAFNAWYDEEHLPALLAVPGFRGARRFRARDDQPPFVPHGRSLDDVLKHPRFHFQPGQPRYLTLYEIDHVAALSHEEYRSTSSAAGTKGGRDIISFGYEQIYPAVSER